MLRASRLHGLSVLVDEHRYATFTGCRRSVLLHRDSRSRRHGRCAGWTQVNEMLRKAARAPVSAICAVATFRTRGRRMRAELVVVGSATSMSVGTDVEPIH